jgi:hypothetical protein
MRRGRTAARRRPRLPLGAAATSSPPARAASPERCTGGPAEGGEQRRWVGGVEAGPRDRPGAARTGEGWWGRGGRIAPPTQQQGRAIRSCEAHRARTRAHRAAKCGQLSGASNELIFAAIGAQGAAPRQLQCAIDDECTLTCTLLRFFISTLCRTGPIVRPSRVWIQNPCGGTRCACFCDCARAFRGGRLCFVFARKRFLEDCATTFSANRDGICTHIAGQLACIVGTRRAKKNHLVPPEGGDGPAAHHQLKRLRRWGCCHVCFCVRACAFVTDKLCGLVEK